jgi:hypothetical protein
MRTLGGQTTTYDGNANHFKAFASDKSMVRHRCVAEKMAGTDEDMSGTL